MEQKIYDALLKVLNMQGLTANMVTKVVIEVIKNATLSELVRLHLSEQD